MRRRLDDPTGKFERLVRRARMERTVRFSEAIAEALDAWWRRARAATAR
jgi:hypothetical protein